MPDTPKTDPLEYEYDVCFSFAYEDQPYVETVVKKLELMGINVFYAPFKEGDLWGRNLYDYFSDIYSKKSRYCVMFISEHYANSVWTSVERKENQARAFQESEPYILPARFDKTEIPGIPKTVAYISLVDKKAEDFATTIYQKVTGKDVIPEKQETKAIGTSKATESKRGTFARAVATLPSQLFGYVSRILSSEDISHEEEGQSGDENTANQVEFSVFSPTKILSGESFILDVWAYLPKDYDSVLTAARDLDRNKLLGRKKGLFIRTGTVISLKVHIDGMDVKHPSDTFIWRNKPINHSFSVNVPDDAKSRNYTGNAIVSCEGLMIARIPFVLKLGSAGSLSRAKKVSGTTFYPETAFASYSRKNRNEVLARIQGIKLISPNLDIFLDVFSLRTGENWEQALNEHVPTKDIFYLFWSTDAAKSQNVEKEWRLALEKRGLDYIDPVPLQDTRDSPPPKELSQLHFKNTYQEYIDYEELKQKMKNGMTN